MSQRSRDSQLLRTSYDASQLGKDVSQHNKDVFYGDDLWNFVKGLGLALVIIFNLPDVKSRLFPKGDGTLTGEEVRARTHTRRVCVFVHTRV